MFGRKSRVYQPRRRRQRQSEPYLLGMKAGPHRPPNAEGRRRRRETPFHIDEPRRAGTPWLSILLLLGAAGALFAWSLRQEILLGQIAAPIVGLAGLHGLLRGGFRKALMLPVSIGMLFLVASNPGFADPIVRAIAGRTSALGNGIAGVLALVLSLTVAGAIVKAMRNRLIVRRPLLLAADRFLGTGIGLAEGALLVLLLCWSTVLLEPRARRVLDHPGTVQGSFQHQFASGLVRLTHEIDESPLEPIARDANVLEEIPSVRDALDQEHPEEILDLSNLDPDMRRKALEILGGAVAEEGEIASAPRSGPLIR